MSDHDAEKQLLDAVQNAEDDFFNILQQVLQVPSVKDVAEEGAPFGKEPRRVLEVVLEMAREMGFKTNVVHDAVGYAQWGDNEQDFIGVVGHLDVVASGSGWDYPPFDLSIDDGIAYGRGVLDNKGPIMACLYALYLIKKLGLKTSKTIRIIFGTDEESGSSDIPMYLKEESAPIFGFTPDCKYPVVYGERGIVGVELKTKIVDGSLDYLEKIEGDFERASIPDEMTLYFKNNEEIKIIGKRSPSNAPDLGENVITKAGGEADVLAETMGDLKGYLKWMHQHLHNQHAGEGVGIAFSDVDSGALQLSPYDWRKEGQMLYLDISIRYPISVSEEKVVSALQKNLPPHTELKIIRSMPSVVHDKNDPRLQVMKKTYERITGQNGNPVTTTGATYARSMPNIVAFGPSFPGQKGIAHNKNEYMSCEDLMCNLSIYALTIYELIQ